MKCLHHTDADGKCAAYWVHKRYPIMNSEDFIMIDYGMNIDWMSKIQKDEFVFIVDFSIEVEEMRKLLQITKNVIWIDHHITAIKKYDGFEIEIKGLRVNGIAGCMLTWAYFNQMNDGRIPFNPKMCNKAPWMTKYIHDHDVWKYEYTDETAHFKLGLDAIQDTNPLSSIWDQLLQIDKVQEIIHNGIIIEHYRDAIGLRACKSNGFEYEIDGHKAFCLNNCFGGSEWFVDIIKQYDLVCAFSFIGETKKWEYSLYSDKIDTSKISVKFGGGGHPGASGFVSDRFIFSDK